MDYFDDYNAGSVFIIIISAGENGVVNSVLFSSFLALY